MLVLSHLYNTPHYNKGRNLKTSSGLVLVERNLMKRYVGIESPLSCSFITHLIITQMINEGEEPENFFWVGIGGKKPYEKVCWY